MQGISLFLCASGIVHACAYYLRDKAPAVEWFCPPVDITLPGDFSYVSRVIVPLTQQPFLAEW